MYLKHLLEEGIEVEFATSKSFSQTHISDLEVECKALCNAHNIPYLKNINANRTKIVDMARKTDICIMGGYDKILKAPIINAPKLGVTNTHLSLIPRHRGCYPIVWAILCDTKAGLTTYVVNSNIDDGILIDQKSTRIRLDDTAKSLYKRVSAMSVDSFKKNLANILAWSWPKITPSKTSECYHTAGMPNARWISWNWRAEFLIKFSRALTFPPYPGPRTTLENHPGEVELFIIKKESTIHNDQPGTIIDIKDNILYVACSNGAVVCKPSQPKIITNFRRGIVFKSRLGDIHPIPLYYDKFSLFT